MTDQKQARERIWIVRDKGEYLPHPYHDSPEYVRKDLYEALTKQRDELAAENERLRVYRHRAGVADDKLERLSAMNCIIERKLKKAEAERDAAADAALSLRNAQRAYMADRGNDKLGRAVASAAEVLDVILAAQKGKMSDG